MVSNVAVAFSIPGRSSSYELCYGGDVQFRTGSQTSASCCRAGPSCNSFQELQFTAHNYYRASPIPSQLKSVVSYGPLNLKLALHRIKAPSLDCSESCKTICCVKSDGTCTSVGCSSSFSSGVIGTLHIKKFQETPIETRSRKISPYSRRNVTMVTGATADSDQTFPSQNGGGEKVTPTTPHPEVHPSEVVQAQLKALRERDLATVFEFASPPNKARTGPLTRFCEMLEGRAYNVMIGHVSAEILSTITISTNRFQQRIVIKGSNGNQATFSWSLSRQEDGPYEACWMTDAVRRDE